MPKRSVILRETRDELGSRYLGASLSADGTLTIEGQDIGAGVEQFFGPDNRDYEWVWTLQAPAVAELTSALASEGDLLAALAERFSNEAAGELKSLLDEKAIRYASWSRVGD